MSTLGELILGPIELKSHTELGLGCNGEESLAKLIYLQERWHRKGASAIDLTVNEIHWPRHEVMNLILQSKILIFSFESQVEAAEVDSGSC